jgi:hypothetical protein
MSQTQVNIEIRHGDLSPTSRVLLIVAILAVIGFVFCIGYADQQRRMTEDKTLNQDQN